MWLNKSHFFHVVHISFNINLNIVFRLDDLLPYTMPINSDKIIFFNKSNAKLFEPRAT